MGLVPTGRALQVRGFLRAEGIAGFRHVEWARLGLELASPVGLLEINRASRQSWLDLKL